MSRISRDPCFEQVCLVKAARQCKSPSQVRPRGIFLRVSHLVEAYYTSWCPSILGYLDERGSQSRGQLGVARLAEVPQQYKIPREVQRDTSSLVLSLLMGDCHTDRGTFASIL